MGGQDEGFENIGGGGGEGVGGGGATMLPHREIHYLEITFFLDKYIPWGWRRKTGINQCLIVV